MAFPAHANTSIHNGRGRPKGKSWSSLIEEISTSEVNEQGESLKRQIVKSLLYRAREGQGWAVKEVLDRMEGKVENVLDLTSGGESLNASINFVGAPSPELATIDAEVIEEKDEQLLIT